MKEVQYQLLTKSSLIQGEDLTPHLSDRTLLYGYRNDSKDKFHVYLKDKQIHAFCNTKEIRLKENWQFSDGVSLYPELCDYSFCRLLRCYGISLPFLPWDAKRQDVAERLQSQFWGYVA